jgi:transposase InsO family protein
VNTPLERREVIAHLTTKGLSERAACAWSGWSRQMSLYEPAKALSDAQLVEQMKHMSLLHPRFGYRRIAVMLGESPRRVWRLWRRHGFKLGKQRKRTKRGVKKATPSERPHRAEHPDHVWTYDIIHDRLADGTSFKMLCLLDEFTRECLAIYVARSIRATDVQRVLMDVMAERGTPEFIRSDNGGEFAATVIMAWLTDNHVGPAFIDPGCPWQNGFVESFHGKLRDECLNREWFKTLQEAKVVIEQWRRFYNTQRPHSALDYKTPVATASAFRLTHLDRRTDFHLEWPQIR